MLLVVTVEIEASSDGFGGGEVPPIGAVGGDEVEVGAGRVVVDEDEEAGPDIGRRTEGGV